MGKQQKAQIVSEDFFRTESIWTILKKIAPPVMLAQLIQALYNIVDSFFVGEYSTPGLTALSIIFPLQLIISALAIGTGVGVNTHMARLYALKEEKQANYTAGTGTVLAVISWIVLSAISLLIMRPYVKTSANSPEAVEYAVIYGNIVCAGSLGLFLESTWTKVHQSTGNMKLPMIAQIAGAVTNIVLDPLLIFGLGPFPEMGVAGAAVATVVGQFVAAFIVSRKGLRRPPKIAEMRQYIKPIYALGYPSILMQSLYTIYIIVLNIILAGFCDEAVTVLGLYYKLQTFFFIPLLGLQTCIVPVISFNFTTRSYDRCRKIIHHSVLISLVFMVVGILCFELIPTQLIGLFSPDQTVQSIGQTAFRIIGSSFIPAVFSLMAPVFFQAIGSAPASAFLSVMRQILCLIPFFWLFSLIGLQFCWFAFPVSEVLTGGVGIWLYIRQCRKWKAETAAL